MVTVTDVGKAKALIRNEKGETRKVPLDRFAFDPQKGDKCEIVRGRNGSMLHKVDPEPEDDYMYDDDPYGDTDDQYDDDPYGNDPYDDAYDDDYDNRPRRRGGRNQQPQQRGRTRQEQAEYDDYAGVNDDGRYANAPRSGQGAPGVNARFDDVTHLYTAASGGEKTVVCPRCSTVYDKSLKNCPVCGAKKGRKGVAAFIIFSWILAILVVFVLVAVLGPKFANMAKQAQASHNALTELTENSNGSRKNANKNKNDENSNDEYDNENVNSNENDNASMNSNSNDNVYSDSDYSNGNVTSNGTVYGDASSASSSDAAATDSASDSGSYYSNDAVNATVVSNQ